MKRPELLGLALLLAFIAAALAWSLQRPDHLVLLSWPRTPPTGELTPRLDALGRSAEHAARGTGPSVVDTLAEELSQSGWRVVEGRGGLESVFDETLEALGGRAPVAVVVRLTGAGPAEVDERFGRTLDGLAPLLASRRTLYVLERGDELYVTGPGAGRLDSPADGLSVRRDFAWTLRLR